MKTEENKGAVGQYLHYFRFWFLAVGILALVFLAIWITKHDNPDQPRRNLEAPAERVYDQADILTGEEEDDLRSRIAVLEETLRADIVLVTIDQPMEGESARKENDAVSGALEDVMEAFADNFWDDNHYGYNKGFEGDGLILVDNVYEGQEYWHLSTSGRVEEALGEYDIQKLLDALAARYQDSCCLGYIDFLRAVEKRVGEALTRQPQAPFPWAIAVIVPVAAALLYATTYLKPPKAVDTTSPGTYVAGGKPTVTGQRDDFLRKFVTTRHIDRSSGSGGSSGRGGGGHHSSRSGASHGGGGRRH